SRPGEPHCIAYAHGTADTAHDTEIGMAGANHMIGRLTPQTLRYITIHAP
ncbi:MAG: hypothetical protein QOF46_3738, partial [Paraburkholderia sp.]|nr:hypothetical protein [Paraburkholderia sp.]